MPSPMPAGDVFEKLRSDRLIAVVRIHRAEALRRVASTLVEGGIRFVELTLTSPGALAALREIAARKPRETCIGVGSVRTADEARASILEGAEFLVSPVFDPEIVDIALRFDRLVIPGAFTPTEVHRASRSGAHAVKVFPADVGGPAYIRALRAPMPELRLVPTGGVNLDTAADFLDAGSFALAVGSALVNRRTVEEGDWDGLLERARRFARIVSSAG